MRLNTEATKEILDKENFDALIIAVGAEPIFPKIPGIDKQHVSWAVDAELGNVPVGDKIVIVGAGTIGIEAAIDFKQAGKDVTVIELAEASSMIMAGGARGQQLQLIKDLNVPIHYGTALTEIHDDKVIAKTGDAVGEFSADTVLVAIGMKSRDDVVKSLCRCAPETSVHIVGDAIEAASICEAVNTAFQAALNI